MRERFVTVIEAATGPGVIGCMSGNQQDPDMMSETFILAPSDLVDGHEVADASDGVGPHRLITRPSPKHRVAGKPFPGVMFAATDCLE